MSGIAAILRLDGAPSDLGAAAASSDRLGPSAIEAMIDALAHRGPDGRSAAVIGPAALGHTLFAATDEDALDAQPLRRGPRAVVADARLDNRRELIGELCSPGEDEPSDAALILHAYERWGEACPSHLTGDFAFVLWDDERHLLLAARDAIGIRPLYYHHDRRALRCASEMLALFAGGEVDKRPHRPSLALWLNGGYSERDQTLYDRVFSLPAGHALVARDGAVDVRRYWWPDPWRQIRYATDAEYADHFGAVFREAVRCRLRARGPVAVVVSGGLDSSSIACEADRLRRAGLAASDPLVLLHLAFPGLPCDEQRYSDAVGERCGTPMIDVAPMDDVELCRPDPSRLLPDVYFHPTVSMFDPLLAEAKARGARVALTGMGGDDLMEGTGWDFSYMIAEGQLRDAAEYVGLTERPLARETWEAVWSYGVRPFIPASVRRIGRKVLPRRTLPWLSREVSEEAWQLAADQARRDAERDYPSRVARKLQGWITGEDGNNPLALQRFDRYAAHRGIDFRHPFYDARLIELLLAFPHEQRVRGWVMKPVLRRALAETLPPLVRDRRDFAIFNPYLDRAFVDAHRAGLRELFRCSRLEDHGMLRGDRVLELLETRAPVGDLMNPLLDATALELWFRQSMG